MFSAQPRERRGRRAQNATRMIAVSFAQNTSKFLGRAERACRVLVSYQHQRKRDEWRITVIATMANLFVIKTAIVLRRRMTKRVMIGMVGLNQDSARQITPARASGDLGNQLK